MTQFTAYENLNHSTRKKYPYYAFRILNASRLSFGGTNQPLLVNKSPLDHIVPGVTHVALDHL
jgi:hypothetical protein